ncbi:NAD(P)-binding protein, partial [Cystobasidium minutum MCA 4210]|uniref:NAD(P)-binding protein n=1 Tax=Cystobasidium minutum MCA 4210 TaxID=1397322 RepID=UPI0034CF7273
FIGGGSQGLGLALACRLAARGAHVTIVSRSQNKLDIALKEVEQHRRNPEQRFHAISANLVTSEGTSKAFDDYTTLNKVNAPEYVFSCQGGAAGILGYFPDLTPEQLTSGWQQNYQAALWISHQASKRMVQNKIQGKIVLVSSLVGLFSFVGYSAYSPAKHAIRGLADTLRNELKMYNIDVHCYFPGTILSPGYEAENQGKPPLTLKIEGEGTDLTPEQCADLLIRNLEKGHFLIATDLVGHLARMAALGASPCNNVFMDQIYRLIGIIGLPIWRMGVDKEVKNSPEAVNYRQSLQQ